MEIFPSNTWKHKRRKDLKSNPSGQKDLISRRRDKAPTKINPYGSEVHLLKCLPAPYLFIIYYFLKKTQQQDWNTELCFFPDMNPNYFPLWSLLKYLLFQTQTHPERTSYTPAALPCPRTINQLHGFLIKQPLFGFSLKHADVCSQGEEKTTQNTINPQELNTKKVRRCPSVIIFCSLPDFTFPPPHQAGFTTKHDPTLFCARSAWEKKKKPTTKHKKTTPKTTSTFSGMV